MIPVLAAVIVFEPAVLRVIEKDPVPDVRDDTEGRVASVSLEVNETGLAKEVAVFP